MRTCTACGYQNVNGAVFCEDCGASLDVVGPSVPWSVAASAVKVPDAPATEPKQEVAVTDAAAPAAGGPTPTSELSFGEHSDEADADASAEEILPAHFIAESGRRLDVPQQLVVIVGREDMRSGTRPDVDLAMDGASAAGVSRRHCRLLFTDGEWRVEDLMSTNHTHLNGRLLAAHTPTSLRDDDELRLGKLRLRFHLGG